jgi:hypothetical protein
MACRPDLRLPPVRAWIRVGADHAPDPAVRRVTPPAARFEHNAKPYPDAVLFGTK